MTEVSLYFTVGNQSQFNDPGKALYYLYHGRDTVTRTQQDVPGQLVYDDADLKPTEDYMDMNKVARKLNPPPPRARGRLNLFNLY